MTKPSDCKKKNNKKQKAKNKKRKTLPVDYGVELKKAKREIST